MLFAALRQVIALEALRVSRRNSVESLERFTADGRP
jgi:hypothetical protein